MLAADAWRCKMRWHSGRGERLEPKASFPAGWIGRQEGRCPIVDRAGTLGWLSFDELLSEFLASESRASQISDNWGTRRDGPWMMGGGRH